MVCLCVGVQLDSRYEPTVLLSYCSNCIFHCARAHAYTREGIRARLGEGTLLLGYVRTCGFGAPSRRPKTPFSW